jgi:hydroxymethylglutaryl-CoA lyase
MMTTTVLPPVKLIECPRDAMQGWHDFIPTDVKIAYINKLLRAGFDTLDFGSFVSAKAIPALSDTAEVVAGLDMAGVNTRLLAIVANLRGVNDAAAFPEIAYIGFPFSVSEEFQKRNTNSTIEESLGRVDELLEVCEAKKKEAVVYLSMGFGNPYGDPWSPEIVMHWARRLAGMGVRILALSDTVGVSTPENIRLLFNTLIPELPEVEFGAHLHSHPSTWKEKVDAAYQSGCRRFDSAFKGVGGCPMAADKLVGNLATEELIGYFGGASAVGLDPAIVTESLQMAAKVFRS